MAGFYNEALISDCEAIFGRIFEKFDATNTTMDEIGELLKDEGQWSGDAHDKCVEAQNVIAIYKNQVRSLLESLRACFSQLDVDRTEIENNSTNVSTWSKWEVS